MHEKLIFKQFIIPSDLAGQRLDRALALLCTEFSRTQLQQWIHQGKVKLNEMIVTDQRQKIHAAQHITLMAEVETREDWHAPQALPLEIIYADKDIIVINKPAGLVVHPGAGNKDQTLVNALIHYDAQLTHVPRAGLIHRLDKQTSGLLLIARNLSSHCHLVQALQQRHIQRIYQTIVQGVLISGGTINLAIGRHSQQRVKMSVKLTGGREAITHYIVRQRYRQHTHLQVQLETGRTHQIRVHLAHIRHPVVGDLLYGRKAPPSSLLEPTLNRILQEFSRQALHASHLTFHHPRTHQLLTFEAPLPADMQELLNALDKDLHL